MESTMNQEISKGNPREPESERPRQHRFYRDGAPYAEGLEASLKAVLSLGEGKNPQQDFFISVILNLFQAVQVHLKECQAALGQTEKLVEEARSREADPDAIQSLVGLCRALQKLQTNLVDQVIQCANRVVDEMLPR